MAWRDRERKGNISPPERVQNNDRYIREKKVVRKQMYNPTKYRY